MESRFGEFRKTVQKRCRNGAEMVPASESDKARSKKTSALHELHEFTLISESKGACVEPRAVVVRSSGRVGRCPVIENGTEGGSLGSFTSRKIFLSLIGR